MAKTFLAVILCLSFAAPVSAAAPIQPNNAATSQTRPAKPDWLELKPAQQKILAQLKDDWSELDTVRRQKWVKVADGYPKLKPEQQARIQQRMKDWAKLAPEQRKAAREKYQTIKKLPPDKRQQLQVQWKEYQQSLAAKSETGATEAAGESGTPQ